MGLIWETSPVPFVVITLVLAGGAAWLAGQALARTWRPLTLVLAYMVPLGAAARFFHWGLAGGSLLSLHYLIVDTAVVMALATVSWLAARADLMVRQYPWLYRRTSFVTWADKDG
jgi:hypothetical protein